MLPEWRLQLQVPGHPLDYALPAPGAETDVFANIARRHKVRIVLPFVERDGDAAQALRLRDFYQGGKPGIVISHWLLQAFLRLIPRATLPRFPTNHARDLVLLQ